MSLFSSHFHPSHHQHCLLAKETEGKEFQLIGGNIKGTQECSTHDKLAETVLMEEPRQAKQKEYGGGGVYSEESIIWNVLPGRD